MLKIYGHPGSRAARPLWVCRELGLQHEHVPTHFADGGTKSAEFLAINPAGRIPAIDDDGFRLAESMAINIYLATYTLGVFKISFGPIGGTELRILLALGNLALLAQPSVSLLGRQVLLYDAVGLAAVAALADLHRQRSMRRNHVYCG